MVCVRGGAAVVYTGPALVAAAPAASHLSFNIARCLHVRHLVMLHFRNKLLASDFVML